ncbi:hypothetical protein HYW35_01485 [Candidatus Saccharibacteria bacterium]|nr:hypothetical protein [Candidatus Saccharibacteria bacterium]
MAAQSNEPGKDVIYVDVEDDITAIISKIESAKAQTVALVLPKRASALQSIVNMRLLKRSAKAASKKPVLVTSEPALLPLAGAAGLQVAKSLETKAYIPPSPVVRDETAAMSDDKLNDEPDEDKATLDYHRSIGELAAAGELEEPEAITLEDSEKAAADQSSTERPALPNNKKLKVPNFDKFRLILGLSLAGTIALIIFIILAAKVLPKATITISTESTKLAASFNLTTDGQAKKIDETKNIIPSVLKTADQTSTQQVQATGQQNNGNKASGSVNMSAGACSGTVPPDIPAGTGLSSNGLTYITQAKTAFAPVVAAGKCTFQSTSSTAIGASSGGTKYNLSSASFSVAGYPGVSVTGSASGGTDNIVTVLGQTDLDNAKQKLTSAETDKFAKDFQNQIAAGFYVVASTYKLGDSQVSSSPAVGRSATTATVTIKITHSVLTLQKDDLKKAVTGELNKQIDLKKQKLSGEDVLKNIQVNVQSQASPTNTTLAVTAETTAIPVIDIEAVKKMVGGQKSGDIKSLISVWPGVKNVEVKMSPFWVSKAPNKPGKIHVVLQELKTDNSSPDKKL